MESIEKYYGSVHSLQIKEEMDKLVETDEFGDDVEVLEEGDEIDLQELEKSSEEAPVVKLLQPDLDGRPSPWRERHSHRALRA